MVLKVTEKCLVEDLETGEESFGIRTYKYKSNEGSSERAIVDCVQNFNSDNIIGKCQDNFDGGCLDSQIIAIEVL